MVPRPVLVASGAARGFPNGNTQRATPIPSIPEVLNATEERTRCPMPPVHGLRVLACRVRVLPWAVPYLGLGDGPTPGCGQPAACRRAPMHVRIAYVLRRLVCVFSGAVIRRGGAAGPWHGERAHTAGTPSRNPIGETASTRQQLFGKSDPSPAIHDHAPAVSNSTEIPFACAVGF